jgi:hypothetical protein
VLFHRGFRDLHIRRLIENTPTSKVRSMAMGMVEVTGRAEGRSRLTAPFSGRDCVYWQVEVQTRGRKRDGWRTVHRNSSGNPFFLRDETGVAMVYPREADCRLRHGVEEECLGISLPSMYSDYLNQNCGLGGRMWRLGAMRFRERLLEESQVVYVLGYATPKSNALTISEGDMDLEATGTEGWAARRIAPIQQEVSAVIRQGQHEKTFIISQDSEKTLTLMLGLTAGLKLVGGPIAALLGLAYWLDFLRRTAS